MARIQIPVVTIVREGVEPSPLTPLNSDVGNYFLQPEGGVHIQMANVSGSSRTVTFISALEVDELALNDLPVVIPAGGSSLYGGFRRKTFNQDSTAGSVFMDVSGDGVLVRAYRFEDAA